MQLKRFSPLFIAAAALLAAPALAKPVSIDLPVSKFARSAQESVVVHCSRGEQIVTEQATHDASLLAAPTKAYINKRLLDRSPVVLVVKMNGYTWAAGQALGRAKALISLDGSLLSSKAEPGALVEVPFSDGGVQGSRSRSVRFPLEGAQDADEIVVASELVAAGLCFDVRDKDRAAAIIRVTVSIELQD